MSTDRTTHDLAAAAAVHAAREQIVQAIGPLAASPLDEHAAALMRQALEQLDSPEVRRAVRRLARPGESRPRLRVVTSTADRTRPENRQAPPVALVESCQPLPAGTDGAA